MATINPIGSNKPIQISFGGTNASTMANTYGVNYYDGTLINTTAVGTSGYVLTSNGAGMAPTFQNVAAGAVTITGDTGGALNGPHFTLTGGTTGIVFNGAGSTETLGGTLVIANGGTNATSMANTYGVNYFDGTRIVTTTVGAATNVLTSNGAGVAPTFQALPANNTGLIKLQSQTANNSAAITFTSTYLTNAYQEYYISFVGVNPGTNGVTMTMDWSTNNGGAYVNSGFQNGLNRTPWNSNTWTNENSTTTCIITGSTTISSAGFYAGQLWLNGMANAAVTPVYNGFFNFGNAQAELFGSLTGTGNAVNNIRFTMSAGNIASGVFTLYAYT